jgi:tetratricopeptide (TPR) repeat protein
MTKPKVFLSYSHDSAAHALRIRNLSDRLRRDGIDCTIDQYEPAPPEGWPRWMGRQIEEADFVLLACTETYARRAAGKERPGAGHGVIFESVLLVQDLYEVGMRNERFIPILFDGLDTANIPKPLRGYTFYRVDQEEGYEELLRHLTAQPRVVKPAVGTAPSLPPENPASPSSADPPQGTGAPARPGRFRRLIRPGTAAILLGLGLALAALAVFGLHARAPALSEILLPASNKRSPAEDRYVEGLEQMARFRLLEAQESFEGAIKLNNKLALAHSALAGILLRRGEIERASGEVKRAHVFSTRLPQDQRLFVEAGYYRLFGQWDESIVRLTELQKRHPADLEVGLALIEVQSEVDGKTALAMLDRLRPALSPELAADPRLDLAEAYAASKIGDSHRLLASADHAVQKARELDMRPAVADGLLYRGIARDYLGRPDQALSDFQEAREIYSYFGNQLGAAKTLNAIANIQWSRGNLGAAAEGFEEARKNYRDLGDSRAVADQVDFLAAIAAQGTDLAAAHRLFQEAIKAHEEEEDPERQAATLATFALLLLDELKLNQAETALTEAASLTKSPGVLADIRYERGRLLFLQARLQEAQEGLLRALQLQIELDTPESIVEIHLALAALSLEAGFPAQAESSARNAANQARGKWPDLTAEGEALLAQALLLQGRTAEAHAAIAEARQRADRTENFRLRLQVDLAEARVRVVENPAAFLAMIRTARQRAARAGHAALEIEAWATEGEVELDHGDPARGRQILMAAGQAAQKKGFQLIADRVGRLQEP